MRRTLRRTLCAIAVAVISTSAFASKAKRPVTLDDLEGVAAGKEFIVTSLDISADGRLVAVERGHRLRVVEAATGRVTKELGEGLIPRWSPDGMRLAFYSNRSGALQIWMWSAASGRVEQLTNLSAGIDVDPNTRAGWSLDGALRPAWSPDGTRIVFPSRVDVAGPAAKVPEKRDYAPLVLTNSSDRNLTLFGVFTDARNSGGVSQTKDGRTFSFRAAKPGEMLFTHLFAADAREKSRKRAVTQLTAGARTYVHPAWSPDGRWLAFAAMGAGQCEADRSCNTLKFEGGGTGAETESEIIALDVATGERCVVATGVGLRRSPRWSPDGSRIAYLFGVTMFADAEIRAAEPAGAGEQTVLTLDRKIRNFDWTDGGGFFVRYTDRGGRLARLAPGTQSVASLAPEAVLAADGFAFARARNGAVVWTGSQQLWLLPAGVKESVALLDLDPAARELDLGRFERIEYRGAHGHETYGVLLYPPDYQSGRKYPVIVDVYPQGGGGVWMHPMEGNQSWASAGYVVFKPMPRAPHVWVNCSRAEEYCRASRGPEAWDVMVEDVMNGIDLLARRGIIDPERMCMYGHSNGSSTVAYLVTRTDRFKCAILAGGSMTDWASQVFLSSDGGGWIGPLLDGKMPWEDPATYIKLSAVYHVDKVKTPMLLGVGDEDGEYLLGAIRMYNALRLAGKEVTLLRYPDQGHLFTGAAMKDFWERQMAFFDKYLKPSQQN